MQGSNSVETVDCEWRPIPSLAPLPLVLHRETPFGRTAMVFVFLGQQGCHFIGGTVGVKLEE